MHRPDALGVFERPGFVDVRARRRWESDGYAGAEPAALGVVLLGGTVARHRKLAGA